MPRRGQGPSSSEHPSVYLQNHNKIRLGERQEAKTVVKILTKHTFCFLLRLREVLLDKLQIKFKLDMLVLQLGITRNKVTRFLRKFSRQTSTTDHFRVTKRKNRSISKTTAESKYSTVVSGTTPSGCTQSAPIGSTGSDRSVVRKQLTVSS